MRLRLAELSFLIVLCFAITSPALSYHGSNNAGTREANANTLAIPRQILKTGISLTAPGVAPNTLQLANNIGLTPVLERIQDLRSRLSPEEEQPTLEGLSARQDLWDATQKAVLIIQQTNMEIDFTVAEIEAEHQLYEEILATFTSNRDKTVARINASAFISNGILWAAAEGFDIPTYRTPKLSIPSGTIGILGGIVPSIASMYTLKAVNGKRRTSEVEPNMLAKLFDYPTDPDIEYPNSIWKYLHQVPAGEPGTETRLDQLMDRWVADANMTAFTDRKSKTQLDIITASVARRKGLSIDTLTARIVMLQQLHAEIYKMKRMLTELAMVVQGEKQITSTY